MHQRKQTSRTLLCSTSSVALLAWSCTGLIGGESEGGPNAQTPGGAMDLGEDGVGEDGVGADGVGAGGGGVAPGPSLRLLTSSQYRSTLAALFPFADELGYELEDIALNGSSSIGAAVVALSPRATEVYLDIARAAAARAFASEESATSFLGCDPSEAGCVEGFLADFGRRAFRRSLSTEEAGRYEGLYQLGLEKVIEPAEALKYVVTAMLGSPHFLYRVEIGQDDETSATGRSLTDVEVASKLAYSLWDGPPDPELLAVAEGSGLKESNALRDQAERLMDSQRLEAGVTSLLEDYLHLSHIEHMEKVLSDFPTFTPSLVAAMREETLLSVKSAILDSRDFREVFNTTTTFVNAELAQHYGIEGVTGTSFVQAQYPASTQRRGLLGQASLLSLHSHASTTSPTLRGRFVREALLCQAVPPPPPDIVTDLPDTTEATTTREKLTLHATDPACAGCHQFTDPIGLGLENFDAIGAFRTQENSLPIDASGELDGVPFNGPAELADAVALHPQLPECFARIVFRHAWGRLEVRADQAFIGELARAFESGAFQVQELLLSAINSPEFYEVGPLD